MTAASRPAWSGDQAGAEPDLRRSRVPVVGMAAAGLAFFLTVTVAAGLLIWEVPAGSSTLGGRALGASPGSAEAPVDQLDRASRTARVGPATLVLPGEPYAAHPDPVPLDGVLDVFWAGAPVHPRYDGRHDWSAAVLLGRMSPAAATGDLEQDGRRAVDRLSARFFGGLPTRVRARTAADHAVDGHPGMLLTATVHYAAPGLPSRYDTVTALLVRLEDGSVVLAATAVPERADPALARQAAAALGTLTVR